MRAIAPNVQPIPIPAAAPVLRPEELLLDDCAAEAVVFVALVVGEVDAELELELELVKVEAVDPDEVATTLDVVAELVAEGFTVVVSKSCRCRGTVSPNAASGWLSHADCMALSTGGIKVSPSLLLTDLEMVFLTIPQHN